MNIGYIPEELQERPQWVLWELRTLPGDKKPRKVPLQLNGTEASSTNPATWTTLDLAYATYADNKRFAGIGYMFSAEDPYTGVDLDGCVVDGELTDEAKAIVLSLNSYTERSQSGYGLHVLVKAQKPGTKCKNSKAGFELYDKERFFIVTGDHVKGAPLTIEPRQAEINALYGRMFGNKKEDRSMPAPNTCNIEDTRIINLAQGAKNGEKFIRLFRGDWSEYGSQSEADQAITNIIAYYTQDFQQIDRIFRMSGLFREKWKRKDYSGETIRKAIEFALEYKRKRREEIPIFDTEDTGNAQRLDHYFGSQIFYCAGVWYLWDGKRWAKDDMRAIKRYGMELAEIIEKKERLPLLHSITENDKIAIRDLPLKSLLPEQRVLKEQLDKLKHQAKLMRTEKGINAALSLAASLRAVRAEVLDADQTLLNVLNGTIDLSTGRLLAHDSSRLITKLAPVEYIPGAPRELWTKTLNSIFEDEGGVPRIDEIRFLQKMLGYCLTGSVREHAFFIFHGRRGRNGKGVINQAVEAIMGDYVEQIPADTLLAKRGDGGGPSPSLAKIRGARLVFAKETDRGRRLDEALLKSLTGGDSITARFLHENEITFRPTFKIVLETNYNPHVDGSDDGIWERIKKLDFFRHFEEHERDKMLGEKLQAEYAGILAWMVEGCLLWQQEGLEETTEMKASKQEAHTDGDPVIAYAEERLLFHRDAWVRPRELQEDYENWSFRNDEHSFKKSELKLRVISIADRKKQPIHWNAKDPSGTSRAIRGVGLRRAWSHLSSDLAPTGG